MKDAIIIRHLSYTTESKSLITQTKSPQNQHQLLN